MFALEECSGLCRVATDLVAEFLQSAEFLLAPQTLHRLNTQLPPLQFQGLIKQVNLDG